MGESEMNFSYRTILKPSNINLTSVSVHIRKKLLNLLTQVIQFTDQQILLKKQQSVAASIFLYMSVLNIFQYKQCLCILTFSKCNSL